MLMFFLSIFVNMPLISYGTQFDFSSFTNSEYELVAIHPEHFLPHGSMLSVLHSESSTPTIYVSARDQHLCKSLSSDSSSLPAFHHIAKRSNSYKNLNVFLVILNAEIKFHWYLHIIDQKPPTTPLPADVLNLIHLTIELVHLLYWNPVPTKGSPGRMRWDQLSGGQQPIRHGRRFEFTAGMDLEARMAYRRALMSGSGHGMLTSLLSLQI